MSNKEKIKYILYFILIIVVCFIGTKLFQHIGVFEYLDAIGTLIGLAGAALAYLAWITARSLQNRTVIPPVSFGENCVALFVTTNSGTIQNVIDYIRNYTEKPCSEDVNRLEAYRSIDCGELKRGSASSPK